MKQITLYAVMLEDGTYYRQETYVPTVPTFSDAFVVARDLIQSTGVVESVYFKYEDKMYAFNRKNIDKIARDNGL